MNETAEICFTLTVRVRGSVPTPDQVADEVRGSLTDDGWNPDSFDLKPVNRVDEIVNALPGVRSRSARGPDRGRLLG
jgi:hypothetical protein